MLTFFMSYAPDDSFTFFMCIVRSLGANKLRSLANCKFMYRALDTLGDLISLS